MEPESLDNSRDLYALPEGKIYFCTHSLGLPPKKAFMSIEEQLKKWATFGAHGWFEGKDNWMSFFGETVKILMSPLLGAQKDEVVVMNSLTVNLHLLLISFYQPTRERYKILIDGTVFPSDLYAIKSHLNLHGFDAEKALILSDFPEEVLENEGERIALVFLSPINFLTGEVIDLEKIVVKAKEKGCTLGLDLAHSAGNIPLYLHAMEIDFAVGCTYKYLSSGPGGPGFAFVHSKHHQSEFLRLSGWWGNDPGSRFKMHLEPNFIPFGGASSWAVSTPSILGMVPLMASLEIVDLVRIEVMRKRSLDQTGYLLGLLDEIPSGHFEVVTPREHMRRGAQISIKVFDRAKEVVAKLGEKGVMVDFRPPDILRVAPSPLYNTFYEIYEFVVKFQECLGDL